MSAVSGLTAKGEKGKSKYVALDINSLYKGKSLENPKATVLPKHGLQSLGKVGAGRRMPPPANLPSLKSENSGNNPNINLVPSGGQGWGTSTKEKGKTDETSATQQQLQQPPSTTSASQGLSSQKIPTTSSSTGPSKTWSSVTSSQEDGGQERSFLGHQSPFFPQEFPKLAGGDVQTEGNRKSNVDSQYGPGPSLRPQTEGSWGRGTLQQQVPSSTSSQPPSSPQAATQGQQGVSGGQPPNNGSGVNGQQNVLDTQVLAREQKSYPISSRGAQLPPSTLGTSNSGATGSSVVVQGLGPTSGGGHGITGQMGPGSNVHPQLPQFRGMMPPYMYGRNFPGGYPNYAGVPPTRQPYPYPENRIRNSMRPLAEEEAYQRPAAIITDKDLKGFDEILQNDSQDGWASVHGEIDYNAKLVFSDEEEGSTSQKKDVRNHEEKARMKENRNYEKDCERDYEQDREENNRDDDWEREECTNDKKERDVDWDGERRERDERWWAQQPQGRPGPPLGMDLQRQWQSQQQQRVPFDYRGPPPRPQGGPGPAAYGSPQSRIGPVPTPQSQQHIVYSPPPPPPPPPPRPNRPGRPPSLTDEDEIWRQRRRQHSDEMTLAVERARQRREEEEKRYEQSKQNAQEKLKNFPENTEKGFSFSRQFQKNVPPRFQKQAELLRQQHQQQPPSQQFLRQQQSSGNQPPAPSLPMGVGYGPHWGSMPPPPPSPYMNQMTGMNVAPKSLSSGRSDSQGSGTDSYDSDRRTPDQSMQYEREGPYWSRERRQQGSLPVPYDGWRAVAPSSYYDKNAEFGHGCEQNSFKHGSEKEDSQFIDVSSQDVERRNREFDNQEYNCREDQDHGYDERQQQRETNKETDSWTSSKDYGDRMPDPFDEPNDGHSSQEKWERPQRPDSRDSRTSKESGKEERLSAQRQGSQSSLSDKDSKVSLREDKEKTSNIDWGDTPYPAEPKRHHEWHHPPPITQKQLESVGPTKKNFTPLRRNATNTFNSSSQEKKGESSRESLSDSTAKKEIDVSIDSEKKEEKFQKPGEADKVEKEKVEKNLSDEKNKVKNLKAEISETTDVSNENEVKTVRSEKSDKDVKSELRDKSDSFVTKKREDHQQRDRDKRQSGRERGIGTRSRGGGRSESSRGRGRSSGYGPGSYGGRSREYRRSRVDKGPRFDKQHDTEWHKEKNKEKEKPSEESSASEVEEGKVDHVRQKDEDSEISIEDTSASTNESVQAEKRRLQDDATKKETGAVVLSSLNVAKDLDLEKNEKKDVSRKDTSKKPEIKTEEKPKEERGGFYPRGEPSRRGRGGSMSIRNSRGGTRYGPSRYGPPPSRAAFGSGRSAKAEEPNLEEQVKEEEVKDVKQDDASSVVCSKSSSNKTVERLPPRRARESLPPRFQKRQAKRYENSDSTVRGRSHGGRGGGLFHSANMSLNKTQAQKENLSDVANEEWETASESSDVAERRERKDSKEESISQDKKEHRDSRNPYMKKSFSGQRPVNDSTNRRPAFDARRGRTAGENRQRDTFGRETRRDSGRGRSAVGSDKRSYTGNNSNAVGMGNSRFGSNSGNQATKNIGRSGGRGTQQQSKYNFAQKNEGSTAVFRIDEIRRDPRGIQAALTDLATRNMKPSDVAPSPKPVVKPEKEKSNALDGYDLNNYASVVIIDDQPEVTVEDPTFLCDADDGFQEVTSKKRHKTMMESDVKKIKKEPRSRNKSGSRLRQNRLPPRLAKQRENNQFHSKSSIPTGDNSLWDSDITPNNGNNKHPVHFPLKDAAPAPPPPVNAWQKPIMLKPHSSVGSNSLTEGASTVSATCTAITSSSTTVITEIQSLTVSSKSSSFDRSDQHDSGIDVSDQPTSAASSQRSSPSNDCKILGPKSAMTTVNVSSSEGCTELDVTNGSTNLSNVRTDICKTEAPEMDENKAIQLPVTFSTKEPFGKGEEGSDMKLDFTYDSELARISEQKCATTNPISRAMQVSSGTSVVGVQSPISPSADELNLKIASVKKVWENVSPMPTVLEHPPAGNSTATEEGPHPDNSFSSFSTNTDHTSSLMNGSVDSSGQSRKESSNMDSSEVPFRTSPSMQQTGNNNLPVSLVPKGVMNIEQSVCKVKTQIQTHQSSQITGCAGPVSPPPIGLDTTIGIRTLAGLASSVQMGIQAVPSPPTVLFNSSQQMTQAGLYQHLPMDGSQVLTQQTRAVAAAIAQFSQPPHGYAPPLGTYGLSHQPASAQLSSAFGQQNVFMQTPPSAHQPQDLYPSSQYRVQPPYPQGQHVSSNQVLSVNAQQNLPASHLLGSQLVQARPTPGPATNPAGPPAPHIQGLHGIQTVQPAPSTSYYSTAAQSQNATSFYPQPTGLTAPGSPMQQQQQPQFPSQQGFGSQSTLNVLTPGAPSVTQNFRSFGGHQFKSAGTVMNSISGGTEALRSSSHSPTMDSNMCGRGVFTVGNTTSTTVNSGSVMTVPQITSTGITTKIGQQHSVACTTAGNARLTSSQRMTSQSPTIGGNKTSHGLSQSSQQYYSFNQQKYSHVQATPGVRPVLFQGVVRNSPHQAQYTGATGSVHYPSPIQRPGGHGTSPQQQQQTQRTIGRTQIPGSSKVAAQLTTAQQAKLRAEAVQQTHRFFNQTSGGKSKIDTSGIEKNRTTIKTSCQSNTNLEETKGLKTNISTTPVLSQDADIQKVIENKDSKLEK